MKNEHKKKLGEALTRIGEAKSIVEMVRDAEQEIYDEMSEKVQEGDKGSRSQEIIDALTGACDNLDEVDTQIEESRE